MRRIMLLCLAGIALLVGLAVFLAQREARPEAEAMRSELSLRDGRLYRSADAVPFTGLMIEKYPEGSLKSRSQISDGLLHGVSEGWRTNGVLEVREHFKHGVSHGVRTKWHEKGNVLSETTIVEGKHHGTFRRWHENGQLAEEVEMKLGDPDGVSLAYYPSGFVKAQATLQRGTVTEQQFWNEDQRKVVSKPTVAN